MTKRDKSLVWAALLILIFVIVPWVAYKYFPWFTNTFYNLTGESPRWMVLNLVVLGIILAVLSILYGISKEESYLSIVPKVISPFVWFYVALLMLGLGNPFSFGVVRATIRNEEPMMIIVSTRVIVLILLVAVIAGVASRILEFLVIREEKRISYESS